MMSPTAKEVVYDGARVVYDSYGTGEHALVFLHGWCCHSKFWKEQQPLLDQYRSIAIDLPGHGRSDAPEGMDYSMETFAESVATVLDAEHIVKVVLVGHSMGACVCTQFVRLHPEQVLGIVYVDGPFQPPSAEWTKAKRLATISAIRDDESFRAMNASTLGSRLGEMTAKWILDEMVSADRNMRVASFPTATQWPAWGYKEVYGLPAVICWSAMGEPDPRWTHHMPQLEIEDWEGFGHFLQLEDSKRFNDSILGFLDKHKLLE